ncbi:GGDEF domain-containing response regulator [Rhizobium alvei]|uniref:diguanylate cyclase n=1 Tax=Rhizobium alvei TaxID=1132659 RepID=A0ABT8YI32_9HYPH|nr:diguanylate cyclase [Rhizobium alvei]MDO6963335.1 diguanylate cyclase [Rhizobium alvei]
MGIRKTVAVTDRQADYAGFRVLLVEDTRLYTVAITRHLQETFGIIVTHCASYRDASIELSSRGADYHLVVLDLCQADAPNGETLELVLDHGLPAIVFSALNGRGRQSLTPERGIVERIDKSSAFAMTALSSAVEQVLQAQSTTVLVCDPDREGAPIVSRALSGAGMRVCRVCSDDEAFSILDANRNIELVLMRGDLAAVNRFAFLEMLRLRYGENVIRVIGYSEDSRPDDVAMFLKAGGDDFVHIPVSDADLLERVNYTLRIHREIQKLQRMASRDYLTDLLNRRYFFERGPKQVEICLRQHLPVSAALLDIDHFKRLNDTYGHEIGDLVLKAVSSKLAALVDDKRHLLARLGGEEFGILFQGIEIGDAYDYCERIRKAISEIRIVVDDEEISVTISMGLAAISDSETFDNYLNAADQYLYLAKHSGRNRVFSDYQVAKISISS